MSKNISFKEHWQLIGFRYDENFDCYEQRELIKITEVPSNKIIWEK